MLAAATGVSSVGLRPPFVTPAAAHSHPDCRGILILIVAPHYGPPLVLMMQPAIMEWFGSSIAATLCGATPAANTPDLMPASEAMARRHIASPAFYAHHA